MIKRILLLIAVLIPISVTLTGCGSKKGVAPAPTYTPAPVSALSITPAECKAVLDGYGQWQKVKLPLNIRLRQPKSMSVSANATMERGKSIMISLRFIGMEVGVLYLTSDSILAIDKFNKVYVSEPLEPLLGGFPANISNVQDLLTGRPFLLGEDKPLATVADKFDFDTQSGDNTWSLIPKKFPKGVEYGFSFNPFSALSLLIVKAGSHSPVNILFGSPEVTPAGYMSPAVSISAMLGKTAVDASLEWNYGKARWNEGIDISKPSIPRGAERISAAKLLKSLPSL